MTTQLDIICHNMIVQGAITEATRCEREYLDHAKEALARGDSLRALKCIAIATKIRYAAWDIH